MIAIPPRPGLCQICHNGKDGHPSSSELAAAEAAGIELHAFEPGPVLKCSECGREITDAEAAYHCLMANPARGDDPARGWHCWECHSDHYVHTALAGAHLEEF